MEKMENGRNSVRDLIIEIVSKNLYENIINKDSEIYKNIEEKIKNVIADEINYKEIIKWKK